MPPEVTSRRRFKSPYWDVPPAKFEHVSPKEYKAMQAAGQVPHSVVNPSSQHLKGTKFARGDPMVAVRAAAEAINAALLGSKAGSQSGAATNRPGGPKTMPPALTRQARRLYVGGIPFGCTDDDMIEFFRSNMEACNFIKEPGNPVLACQINLNKNFAFLEFRTVEETTWAMALDGIPCKGQALKIRRPHDYQPIPGSEPTPAPIGGALSGLPVGPAGTLSGSGGGGVANALLTNPGVIAGLATATANAAASIPAPVQLQVPGLPCITPSSVPRVLTEVLCLMNMVEPDELRDDDEYQDIVDDIVEECSRYGTVKSIEIPRPSPVDPEEPVPGLGKVFVEFDSATEAQRAQLNLAGRRFANRVVVTSYFNRDRYKNKEF